MLHVEALTCYKSKIQTFQKYCSSDFHWCKSIAGFAVLLYNVASIATQRHCAINLNFGRVYQQIGQAMQAHSAPPLVYSLPSSGGNITSSITRGKMVW